MKRQWRSGVGAWSAIGLAMLLSLTPVQAGAAEAIGVGCARAKLRALEKASSALLKCYAGAGAFGTIDPACPARVRQRMNRAFAVAERQECFGFQDDAAEVWTLVEGCSADAVRNLTPPAGCDLGDDGLTCGGQCPTGYTCSALGEQCGCHADALTCDATAIAPALCPKIGQTCVDRTCTDPPSGYCREEPAGSGRAEGFCPGDSTCLALPLSGGAAVRCLPRIYACEDPAGTCRTSGTMFGFCTDAAKSCGPDCLCH